jgi:hypothetical protein
MKLRNGFSVLVVQILAVKRQKKILAGTNVHHPIKNYCAVICINYLIFGEFNLLEDWLQH